MRTLAILFGAVAMAGCATTRTVVVQDAAGRPIPGALVYLRDANLSPLYRNEPQLSRTDTRGEVRFKSAGTIQLQVSGEPGSPATAAVVRSKDVIVLNRHAGRDVWTL